jgi:hypothetical protein
MKFADMPPERKEAYLAQRDSNRVKAEAIAARHAARVAALAEIPEEVNDITALRDKLNEVLAILRGTN